MQVVHDATRGRSPPLAADSETAQELSAVCLGFMKSGGDYGQEPIPGPSGDIERAGSPRSTRPPSRQGSTRNGGGAGRTHDYLSRSSPRTMPVSSRHVEWAAAPPFTGLNRRGAASARVVREGLAAQTGPESCAPVREALTGVRAGLVFSR